MNGLSAINKVNDFWLGDRGSVLENEQNISLSNSLTRGVGGGHLEESADQNTVLYIKHS
jgi:hypothetical protein